MIVFSASIALVLICLWAKRIPLISPYGMFVGFQCLYNVVPYFAGGIYSLDPDAIQVQLVLAAVSNVAFSVAVLWFYRHREFVFDETTTQRSAVRYYLCCVPLFLVALILCRFWGWHTFVSAGSSEGGSLMTSITAHVKHLTVVAYLYSLYRFGLSRVTAMGFVAVLLLMFVDGGRTNFFSAIVLTLMLWQAKSRIPQWKVLGAFVFLVAAMQVVRSAVVGGSTLLSLVGPLVTEGCMADYSTLQSIAVVQTMPHPPYLYLWGSLDSWIHDARLYMPGEFAPLGGIYYISEAMARLGYAGPPLFSFLFGWLLCRAERWKVNRQILYLAFMNTIGLLFVKSNFEAEIKGFIAELLCFALILSVRRCRNLVAWSVSKTNPVDYCRVGAYR